MATPTDYYNAILAIYDPSALMLSSTPSFINNPMSVNQGGPINQGQPFTIPSPGPQPASWQDWGVVGGTALVAASSMAGGGIPGVVGGIGTAFGAYAAAPQSFQNVGTSFGMGMTQQMQIMQNPSFYGLYGIN